MKIYKFEILTDKNNPGYLHPFCPDICAGELPDDNYNQMKWDKINVVDYPSLNSIYFISDNYEKLRDFCSGMSEMYGLINSLLKIRGNNESIYSKN